MFLAFCPNILGGGRDLRMMFLLINECSFSGGDTQTLLVVLLKVELYALPGSGDARLWVLALVPIMMKLAFLSEFVEAIKSRSTVMCRLGSLTNQNFNSLNRANYWEEKTYWLP